jgi:hypothetical protein
VLQHLEKVMASDGTLKLTIEGLKTEITKVETGFATSHVVSTKSLDNRV